MFRSRWCIHTFLILTRSSMTQPVLQVSYFSRFLIFIIGFIFTNSQISFSHPNFYLFFQWCLLKFSQTKCRWPRTNFFWLFVDLNIGLLASFWESWMLGAEDGYSGRWCIFCSLCFQPLPDSTFFSKTMLAFLFLLLMEIIKKLLCFFDFSKKLDKT